MIRNLISRLDRLAVRTSRGRLGPVTGLIVPTLVVRTTGRRSATERLVPLVYVRDRKAYVVGNARPEGRRPNPWVLNLRAMSETAIQVGRRQLRVTVEELTEPDIERLWPALAEIWPALDEFFAATGERSMFALHPGTDSVM